MTRKRTRKNQRHRSIVSVALEAMTKNKGYSNVCDTRNTIRVPHPSKLVRYSATIPIVDPDGQFPTVFRELCYQVNGWGNAEDAGNEKQVRYNPSPCLSMLWNIASSASGQKTNVRVGLRAVQQNTHTMEFHHGSHGSFPKGIYNPDFLVSPYVVKDVHTCWSMKVVFLDSAPASMIPANFIKFTQNGKVCYLVPQTLQEGRTHRFISGVYITQARVRLQSLYASGFFALEALRQKDLCMMRGNPFLVMGQGIVRSTIASMVRKKNKRTRHKKHRHNNKK